MARYWHMKYAIAMSHLQPVAQSIWAAEMIECGSLPPRSRFARLLGEAAVIVLLCASVLAPNITLSPSFPFFRTETLLLAGFLVVYTWLLLTGSVKPPRLNAIYSIGLLFSIATAISLIYGATILNHEVMLRDFYEIPKCWLPVLFFTLAYEAELSEKGLTRLLNYFAVAIALVCFYGWAQFLKLGIADRLNPYYTDFGHNYLALIKYNRILSTMANPNSLGQLMSWALCIYLLAFLFDVGSRLRNVSVSLMCAAAVALTGSRYGLLASALGVVLILWISMSVRRRGSKQIALLLVLALSAPLFLNVLKSSYWAATRFEQLKNPLQVDSLRGRLDVLWIEAGEYILSSPWVGHGPAKSIFDGVFTDSEYLDILKFYGLAGFLAYLGYYLWPLLELSTAVKRLRRLNEELEERLKASLLTIRIGTVLFCVALFMNIGEFTFYNSYLVAFLWIWGGLSVRAGHFVTEAVAQCAMRDGEAAPHCEVIPSRRGIGGLGWKQQIDPLR